MPTQRTPAELQPERIVMTIELLVERIDSRLPGRHLLQVATMVRTAAADAVTGVKDIQQPNRTIRIVSFLLIALIALVVSKALFHLKFTDATGWEMLEGIDAGISSVVYLGLVIVFLATLETRLKRRRTLRALQELRALAHVIDMHQLSKDPEQSLHAEHATADSPDKQLPPQLLSRYLDYCSDLLALLGKVAALYAQNSQDGVVLQAVDEVENLTASLSTKVWQKIMIIDQVSEIRSAGLQRG